MESVTFPDVIDLNVGGKPMTTLLSTLVKDPESMLAAMFSGRHVISKDKDGRFVIDCNADLFEHVLNFLRFGSLPTKDIALEVYDIAVYFGIQSLVKSLENYYPVQYRKRIEDIKSKIDIQEYERVKQEAINKLYTCSARPQDIKVLHIRSKRSPVNCSCSSSIFRLVKAKIHIYLNTDSTAIEEIKYCLAHDMCELGYAKYTYFHGPLSYNCYCYRGEKSEHQVILVAHELTQ